MPNVAELKNDEQQEEKLVSTATTEVQVEALAAGWIPPERFRGKPEDFRDADAYLERAHTVLPIVNAKNRELQAQVERSRAENAALAAALKSTQTAVAALEEAHAADLKEQVELARKEVKEQLAAASERGDHAAIAELTEQMGDLRDAEKEAKEKAAAAKTKPLVTSGAEDPALTPELKAWMAQPQNSWFGKDHRKTSFAMGVAQEMREDFAARGEELPPQADFLRTVEAEVEKTFGGRAARTYSKVGESAGGGGTRRNDASHSFTELPREAKEACHAFNNQLVGPKKRYKTVADWEKAYTKTHFEQEQG